jgi:hypothetical protein
VWPFSSMELGVAFQVMQATETRLTCWTLIWLLLTVRQEMALEIVVPRKVGGAIRALVTFRGWRLWTVLISRQTHLTGGSTRVVLGGSWTRKGECPIAGQISRIWCDELVLMVMLRLLRLLLLLLLLLGRRWGEGSFLTLHRPRGRFSRGRGRSRGQVV